MSPGTRLGLLLLAALAATSWWLKLRMGQPPAVPTAERPAAEGFYMTEAEITSAGPDGLPRYRVTADEIRQLTLDGPTQLKQVRVEYNVYSPSPWLLTAPEGVLSADQARLELWGGVEILGESGDHGPAAAEMQRLEVDTTTHIARTSSPVDLKLGPQKVSGVGMIAYLLEERLQLQSSVHGRFLP